MRKGPKAVVWTVIALMALGTVVQLIGVMKGPEAPADARTMLYEASLFQVELLSGFIGEAGRAVGTDELNGLKQAAYSVEYTHARLVQATVEGIPELRSVSLLMELIVRLQIGGDRQLKAEEAELFTAVTPFFHELYNAYAALLSGDGRLDQAAAERVRKADEEISSLFRGGGP